MLQDDPKFETFLAPSQDRRSADRLPIGRDARYKLLGRNNTGGTGIGKVIDISGSGVLFTTEHPLSLGSLLEVAIDWPVQLDGKCPLQLVVRGKVVRAEQSRVAISIERHEFRTRGTSLLRRST